MGSPEPTQSPRWEREFVTSTLPHRDGSGTGGSPAASPAYREASSRTCLNKAEGEDRLQRLSLTLTCALWICAQTHTQERAFIDTQMSTKTQDCSGVKSTDCSHRGPGFSFQHPHNGSQPLVTLSVPGNPTPSSGLCQYCIHAVHRYTGRLNTYAHKNK